MVRDSQSACIVIQLPLFSIGTLFCVKVHALTPRRMNTALLVAVIADLIQLAAGPFGWTFFDEVIDVVAMLITTRLLGFHWLLLPTFLLEFIPGAGMLPTWTGCVFLVIRARKKAQQQLQQNLPPAVQ